MNRLWVEKYKPKKITDVIGNKFAISTITTWLDEFESNHRGRYSKKKKGKNAFKKCLLIIGKHGVGKSVSIDIILKEKGYDIQPFNIGNVRSSQKTKSSKKPTEFSFLKSNIVNMIRGKRNRKIALIIDEIETFTSSTEKSIINRLIKENETRNHFPMIFISNNHHNKFLSDIRKASLEVKFKLPFRSDLIKLLEKISLKEKIKYSSNDVINKIVEHSQYDFRRLVAILQELSLYNKKIINEKLLTNFFSFSQKKDEDKTLFDNTKHLLEKYHGISSSLRCYESEKVLLPLMIHQNYHGKVFNTWHNVDKQIAVCKEISEALSNGDVIENYIYGDQNWNLQELHGFYTCVLPSYFVNEKEDNSNIDIVFASDLNKTSIRNINKKNIVNAKKNMESMDIFDFINLNAIVSKLITEGQISEVYNILKEYNIKLECIESILKIDKIKSTKTTLTTKQKKEVKELTGEIECK
jgi:DNA polymerase III delta prime subunit